ncbi:MAG: hypothetical protein AAFU67_06080 [Bacteroidota bacterium]
MDQWGSLLTLQFDSNFLPMTDDWQLNFSFNRIRHLVMEKFNRKSPPDLNALLFLIGMQELGRWQAEFTKEEKQDLMHIAICRLLAYDGHYTFVGRDEDGWPHYELHSQLPKIDLATQEQLLKEKIVQYFDELETEEGSLD